MRGKAHAHLIEADDGCAYVVKFTNNPQGGRRVLVNEFIGSILLARLGVATPERAFVHIDDQCVSNIGPLPAGLHFGSRHPGNPDTIAVWDFLPDVFLPTVYNRSHFLGALVFDQWISNAGFRQAIFFRQPATPRVSAPGEGRWVTQMIDNGDVFGGSDWTLGESAVHGMYRRRAVYSPDLSIHAFDPWLDGLMELRFEVLDDTIAELPRDWVRGDERTLEGLVAQLYKRRLLVPTILERALDALRDSRLRLTHQPEVRPRTDSQTTA
jgi:hypothetical protein